MQRNTARSAKSFIMAVLLFVLVGLSTMACSGGGGDGASQEGSGAEKADTTETGGSEAGGDNVAGIRLVSATDGAAIAENPPDDLVVLDVRTPEEFAEGHLEGAVMLDFYEADFAERLAELDPDVPYLLYCRSGNRSGQTATLMADLGFNDVADVDGGILAWNEAELPTVTP